MPPLAIRRALLDPLIVCVMAALTLLSPLVLLAAGAASAFDSRRRAWRLALLVLVYLSAELRADLMALVLATGFGAASAEERARRHYLLVGRFLARLREGTERRLHFRMRLDCPPEVERVLRERRGPLLVLARHSGVGDSFLVVELLLNRFGRTPRIVMKRALQLDPIIDVFGNRLPNCFVGGRGGAVDAIGALSRDLGPSDALVIFPEGGNSSPERRRRRIGTLVSSRRIERARRALRMTTLVAPRSGGVLAALEGAPDADVVLVGHVGLPEPSTLRGLWRGIPFNAPARVWLRHVPRADIPEAEESREAWLDDAWSRLDAWVAEAA